MGFLEVLLFSSAIEILAERSRVVTSRVAGLLLVEEAGGLLDTKDLRLSRLLNSPPAPYARERFDRTYQWTLGWGLVAPGATYENTVDNRAWE